MKILVTNDDGYQSQGLKVLVKVLRKYGDLVIVAPKTHQSGMSMAVSMGLKPIAVKMVSDAPGEQWWYLDGTPASCVKFGIDNIMTDAKPDLVVSGINHGSNAATATLYSGTVGSAMEGAVNRVPAIALSLDDMHPECDFSAVERLLPEFLDKFLPLVSHDYGVLYNVNFPNLPFEQIKGFRLGRMGHAHWEEEYKRYDLETFRSLGIPEERFIPSALEKAEKGEIHYVMVGDFTDEADNTVAADHRLVADGWVSVCPLNIDSTDYGEIERLKTFFD